MKKLLVTTTIILTLIFVASWEQGKAADKKLSNFVGYKAESIWTEHLTTGETRYMTKWSTPTDHCSAVISEKHNTYSYKTEPVCFKPKEER